MEDFRDDYCEMLNDGFGCHFDDDFGKEYCMGCKLSRLKELSKTIEILFEEIRKDHE